MVVLSALNDFNAPINNYFMLDAAVAIEALQGKSESCLHVHLPVVQQVGKSRKPQTPG
jgi:hypothetical protein